MGRTDWYAWSKPLASSTAASGSRSSIPLCPPEQEVPMGLIARVTAPKAQTGNVIRDSAMGLVPETVDAFAVLNKSVWKSEHVRPAMLEMVRLRNARTVNCVFCKSVRYDIAKADGLSEDKVDSIADGYEDSNLSDMEKAALAFTDAYLFDPKGVTPALKARLN